MEQAAKRKGFGKKGLVVAVLLIVGLYFLIEGLIAASGFLGPLTLAVILSMVLIPLVNKMEMWGLSRSASTFVAVFITFSLVAIIIGLLIVQVNSIAKDWKEVKENVRPGIEQLQQKIQQATGATPEQQTRFLENNIPILGSNKSKPQPEISEDGSGEEGEQQANTGGGQIDKVSGAMMAFVMAFGNFLLVFVYVFFMLLYRRKLKLSFLKFFPNDKREEAHTVLLEAIKVAEQYLAGRLLLIIFLAIFYGVGFAILGIKSAIFIAIFAALLSLIPYIGNIIAFFLALVMAAFAGADLTMVVGIFITFAVAQFIESYILEPYLVGDKVDLNPLLTILVVVVGGAVWGAMGMIISIPVFAIIKIISDHIPDLHPIGYTLGVEDISSGDENAISKLIRRLKKAMQHKRDNIK